MNDKNRAKKNIYDMAVEKHGKETTIGQMKKAFGSHKTKALEFAKQQAKIGKERSEYAKKYPGTYKGRPIHELRKEAGLE